MSHTLPSEQLPNTNKPSVGFIGDALAAGFIVVSADYTLLSPADGHAIIEDVKALFTWLSLGFNKELASLGTTSIRADPANIVATGSSAGGFVAYLAASRFLAPTGLITYASVHILGSVRFPETQGDLFPVRSPMRPERPLGHSERGAQTLRSLSFLSSMLIFPSLLAETLLRHAAKAVPALHFKREIPPFLDRLPQRASDARNIPRSHERRPSRVHRVADANCHLL